MAARRLIASVAASAAVHGAAAAWLQPGAMDSGALAQPVPLTVSLRRESPVRNEMSTRRERRAALGLPVDARYYTAKEVDIKATPLEMKTRLQTFDNFPLGRIATVKLRLFISEQGRIDSLEILHADRLPDPALLRDFREVRFRPAERGGRPVKSQKVVEISFVP
jgi:Gram-negative bacterial TonB protein C-terminal